MHGSSTSVCIRRHQAADPHHLPDGRRNPFTVFICLCHSSLCHQRAKRMCRISSGHHVYSNRHKSLSDHANFVPRNTGRPDFGTTAPALHRLRTRDQLKKPPTVHDCDAKTVCAQSQAGSFTSCDVLRMPICRCGTTSLLSDIQRPCLALSPDGNSRSRRICQ